MTFRSICCIVFSLLAFGSAWAGGTPQGTAFTYQGVLKQGGAPLNGICDLTFRLFDAPTAGSALGMISMPGQVISDGLVTATLDFGALAFSGDARWLEIQIDATTLSPRQNVAPTPYALHALNASYVPLTNFPTGGTWSLSSGLDLDSGTLHVDPSSNRVGIGTATPATALDVAGTARVSAFQMPTGAANGKVLRSDSGGVATWGIDGLTLPFAATAQNSSGGAVFKITATGNGAAIEARGISSYGISATSDSGTAAILGYRQFSGGVGVLGSSDANDPVESAIGVRGTASDQTVGGTLYTYGGYFTASSFQGLSRGVYGSGKVGGYFQSGSSSGVGVFAHNSATSGFTTGLWGAVDSATGIGVYGLCVPSTGTGKGVYGECASATGHGVFSNGRFGASGTKSFRIDHPDDPTGKYLLHYSAESPDVINFYSGKVTLDSSGAAIIELPAYFAKINKDPRYTLTAIGAAMPNLHIAVEIDDDALQQGAQAQPSEAAPICSFRIAGGAPGAKVSWRVDAVRNDRYMQRYGAPVEQNKTDGERGLYQQPELYGQPREMGESYRPSLASSSDVADVPKRP